MQKKIHECSENLVSEEALLAVLDVSAHSAKPTFILRKSKGNSYSQTCIIFPTGWHSKLVRATFVLYKAAAVFQLLRNYNHKFQFVRLKLHLARRNSLEWKQIES